MAAKRKPALKSTNPSRIPTRGDDLKSEFAHITLLTSETTVLAVDEELRVLRALPNAAALLTKGSLLPVVDGTLRHERARVQARLALGQPRVMAANEGRSVRPFCMRPPGERSKLSPDCVGKAVNNLRACAGQR
jgi:hypothetical protein